MSTVSRRFCRNAIRLRHYRLTKVWKPERDCRHDLNTEPVRREPPAPLPDLAGLTGKRRRNARNELRRQRQADKLGITVTELRERSKDLALGYVKDNELAARAKVKVAT